MTVSRFPEIEATFTVDETDGAISGSTRESIPMYYYIKFDAPMTETRSYSFGNEAWARFDTSEGKKVVGMRIATSLISVDQAKANLMQHLLANDVYLVSSIV